MKKVIAIIGSLRKESINRTVFNKYKELSSQKIELIEGKIKDIPMYNQDLDTSDKPRPVQDLSELIKGSDAVIFFSPEYNYSVPGVLKNAIDWLSRCENEPFKEKTCSIIGASPSNIGTARMQYHLRQIGVFLNMNFTNKPEVMIGSAFDKIEDGELTDTETIEHLEKHIDKFISKL
jgi:chromate reductase